MNSGLRRRGDYEVLALLRRTEPRTLTPAELADQLLTSASGMTGKIDRLERQGLVERRPDAHDRRAINLELTDQGRSLVEQAFDTAVSMYRQMLSDLNDTEIAAFDQILTSLLARLELLERLHHPWDER